MTANPLPSDAQALNQQAVAMARRHTGGIAWPTLLLVAVTLAGMAAHLISFAAWALPLWAAILLHGVLTYFSYTPLHEAAHGNVHGTHDRLAWLGDLCGRLVSPFIAVPYTTHRVEHFTHHRYTNQPDRDPDFIVAGMSGGFIAFLTHGIRFLWMQNTFLFREHWATMGAAERRAYWIEVATAIGWRVAAFVWLASAQGPAAAAALLIGGYLIGAFFTAYWFAYRPHLPYREPARWRNTNSLLMPAWLKPLEWFWLGQNLHSIHHLFPRVPFYRYHALHREIEPILRAQGTPVIGIFSRKPA